jgi:hypothetical protein
MKLRSGKVVDRASLTRVELVKEHHRRGHEHLSVTQTIKNICLAKKGWNAMRSEVVSAIADCECQPHVQAATVLKTDQATSPVLASPQRAVLEEIVQGVTAIIEAPVSPNHVLPSPLMSDDYVEATPPHIVNARRRLNFDEDPEPELVIDEDPEPELVINDEPETLPQHHYTFPRSIDQVRYVFDDNFPFSDSSRTKYNKAVSDIMSALHDNSITESMASCGFTAFDSDLFGLFEAVRLTSGIEFDYVVTTTKYYQAMCARRLSKKIAPMCEQYYEDEE